MLMRATAADEMDALTRQTGMTMKRIDGRIYLTKLAGQRAMFSDISAAIRAREHEAQRMVRGNAPDAS